MRNHRWLLWAWLATLAGTAVAQEQPSPLRWSALPELPDPVGLGGPFVGVHGRALIVAGGANFPDGPPWPTMPDGKLGRKVWHDRVYVLSEHDEQWHVAGRLPHPLAYGASVSTPEGVLLIGGSDESQVYDEVWRLRWDADSRSMSIDALPPLPQPTAFCTGELLDGAVYVVAGKTMKDDASVTRAFWRLSLDSPTPSTWESLPVWDGPARFKAVTAVQSGGGKDEFFYLLSGAYPHLGANKQVETDYLTDVHRFDPKTQQWRRLRDIPPLPDGRRLPGAERFVGQARPVTAGCAVAVGQSHILVFGGVTGRFTDLPLDQRPLMPREVFAYHTITDTWVTAGEMPQGVVTTRAVWWQDQVVVASGEIRPGIRTPRVQAVRIKPLRRPFGAANWVVLCAYLVALVGIGFFFSKREKGIGDYFLAGGRIPWWAAGLSIYATQLSAITYVSAPAVSFATNWLVYPGTITLLLMAPIVVYCYLPFFRHLNVTTAYEYLERRFSLPVRLFGSLSFVTFQVGRMAIVVYLPALALSAVTGINVYVCIALMGALAMLYTVLGGMEAVVWTDVLQTLVLWGGVIAAIVIVVVDAGGVAAVFQTAAANQKLQVFHWTWDTSEFATWLVVLGMFGQQWGPYTTDQAVIQRYMSTADERAAARGIWMNGLLALPFSFIFFSLGTCLYVYFRSRPELLTIGMENDKVFPLFVASSMPAGLSGLVIAGVFAASMSSLDSSMHSIATAVTTDFYRRFRPQADDHRCLVTARVLTVIAGTLGTGVALLLATYDIRSLWFLFQKVLGLVSSGVVGTFFLGVFTRRANSTGVLTGAAASFAVLAWIVFRTPTNFYLYAAIGIITAIVVGYLASLPFPAPAPGRIAGLTVHTLRRKA